MQCSGGPVAIQNYRFPIFVETMPSNFGVLGKHQNSSVIQKNRMLMAFFFPFHCFFFFFLVPHFGLEYVFIYCKILSWPLHAHWAFQNKSHTLHPLTHTHMFWLCMQYINGFLIYSTSVFTAEPSDQYNMPPEVCWRNCCVSTRFSDGLNRLHCVLHWHA